jgi:hypothetical protein
LSARRVLRSNIAVNRFSRTNRWWEALNPTQKVVLPPAELDDPMVLTYHPRASSLTQFFGLGCEEPGLQIPKEAVLPEKKPSPVARPIIKLGKAGIGVADEAERTWAVPFYERHDELDPPSDGRSLAFVA